MDNRASALNKRLNTDRVITLIVAFLMIFVAAMQFITFERNNDILAVRRGIHSVFSAIALILLYLGLNRIAATGKPFDSKMIGLLRAIAVTIMIGGFLPPFVEGFINITQGKEFVLNQLKKMATNTTFIDHMQYEPHQLGDVIMLTGVGEVFPFIRVHSLLDAMQPHFSDVPIVVMYPGSFDGRYVKLFDKLTPNPYYRAFNIV